MTVTQPFNIVN